MARVLASADDHNGSRRDRQLAPNPQTPHDTKQLTRSYYEANAEEYATATLGATIPSLTRFVGMVQPQSLVVDLGSGSGRDLRALSAHGFRPVGLDYAESLARYAHRTTRIPMVNGDLRRLPFLNASIDGAWAAASLLHLRRGELSVALAEVARVVKPGAPFFASLKQGLGEGRDVTGRWFTYYSRVQWEAALRAAGFSDIEISEEREATPRAGGGIPVVWLVAFARAGIGRRSD